MKLKPILATVLLGFFSACTSVEVQHVQSASKPVSLVYIERNPDASDDALLGIIEVGLQRRGIETKIVSNEPVPESAFVLTYSASNGWDLTTYLKHAELRLKEGNRLVASAVYHHRGGYGLNKYASTESKITPVVSQLLSGIRTR